MHQFFQQFGQQVQQPKQIASPNLQNNLTVLEIYNNWEYVLDLYFRMMEGSLKELDVLETSWIGYMNSNGLNMETYKDAEDFIDKHLRPMAEKIKEQI